MNRNFLCVIFLLIANLAMGQSAAELYKKSVNALNKDNVEESLKYLDEILQKDPRHKDALTLRSYIYYNVQEYEKALVDLDTLIVSDSLNLDALKNRSRVKSAMRDVKGCIDDINRMIVI